MQIDLSNINMSCVFINALIPRLSFLGLHYIDLQVKMYIFEY